MTTKELEAIFEKNEDEFLKFGRIEKKRSKRSDIHAFLLLDEIFPGENDMVSGAEHDKIWLYPADDEIAELATEDQIVELIRCGVMYESDHNAFSMFV